MRKEDKQMYVLYVTRLTGNSWVGPTHSVPMQIKYQSGVDKVFWINLRSSLKQEWKQLPYYREVEKEMQTGLRDMPEGFQKPDLVVFQGVYEYPFAKIVQDIWKQKIPYVIVPRSALTADAQKKAPFKKWLGNLIFFNRFIGRAAAIQYLTAAEQADSAQWKTASFIAPNGMNAKDRVKESFSQNQLILSYVGRLERYQKGLDLLVCACAETAQQLREANATIHLYGPDREGSVAELIAEIKKQGLEDIIYLHDGVFGEEKDNVLLNSDAFIMTSRFEGLPMGMIEALACGLPALATAGTNLANEIKQADAGWVSDNTVEGIVEMLKAAICDRDRYPDKSKNAVALSERYNWESIAKDTHLHYQELVNRGK